MGSFACRTTSTAVWIVLSLSLLQFVSSARSSRLYLPSEKTGSVVNYVELSGAKENSGSRVEDAYVNNRPLIGILSQPGDGDGEVIIKRKGSGETENVSYIAASYVKFVEAGGARAVPLIYNEPEETLERKFAAINGVLFPGGSTSLGDTPFYRTAEKIFNMAIAANDKGDYFPVYGVCLGFELLSVIVSQNHSILEHFEAEKQPGPLMFVSDSAKQHSMFKWIPHPIIEKLSTQSLAMENHQKGISPDRMASNGPLSDFFRVLTTTPDQDNKIYVSTVESHRYPVTAVQWHPEKNAFEWGVGSIPHSADAIELTQSVANFVISEARKSHHKPASDEEENDFLIYNQRLPSQAKMGRTTLMKCMCSTRAILHTPICSCQPQMQCFRSYKAWWLWNFFSATAVQLFIVVNLCITM